MKRLLSAASAACVALVLGCASQNIVQTKDAGSGDVLAARKIAVVPFRSVPRAGADPLRGDVAPLVAGYIAEGFAARGLETVPASDVEQALQGAALSNQEMMQIARDRFGADAVVTGTVYRFRERGGQALGTTQPASVGFQVSVYAANGKLFRSKIFDHTQVALGENALTAGQYPGRGTRWLTAEELARWGATQLVNSLPLQ